MGAYRREKPGSPIWKTTKRKCFARVTINEQFGKALNLVAKARFSTQNEIILEALRAYIQSFHHQQRHRNNG